MVTCSAVEAYDCEAPAGIRLGGRTSKLPGVKRSELLTCAYCGEPVCKPCSTMVTPPKFLGDEPVPVGLDHSPEDLADWLGL